MFSAPLSVGPSLSCFLVFRRAGPLGGGGGGGGGGTSDRGYGGKGGDGKPGAILLF